MRDSHPPLKRCTQHKPTRVKDEISGKWDEVASSKDGLVFHAQLFSPVWNSKLIRSQLT